MAEITMSLIEYQDLQSQRDEAQQRCAMLEERMRQVELTDPTGRVPGLVQAIEAALPIVQFAVGNLAPETVRGWPYDKLLTFAEAIDRLPGADAKTKAYALEFHNFVREAKGIEAMRSNRDEARALTPHQYLQGHPWTCVGCRGALPLPGPDQVEITCPACKTVQAIPCVLRQRQAES